MEERNSDALLSGPAALLVCSLSGKVKRTSDMSDRFLEILGESCGERFWIPTGRQLPRTPPLMDVNRRLDFEDYDIMEVHAEIVLTAPVDQT